MRTLICPYCGCSLVRLGISKEKAATYSFAGTDAPTLSASEIAQKLAQSALA